MQCHFNYAGGGTLFPDNINIRTVWDESTADEFHPEGTLKAQYCENEGTHCVPCADQFCDHTVNLVCDEHHAYITGFGDALYGVQEASDPENFDPEDFTILYDVIDRFLLLDNYEAWDATNEVHFMVHNPDSPLRPPAGDWAPGYNHNRMTKF